MHRILWLSMETCSTRKGGGVGLNVLWLGLAMTGFWRILFMNIPTQKWTKIFSSQLAFATFDGTAFNIVWQYDYEKYGNQAWKSLIEWYEGDMVKYETAKEI